MAGELVKVSSTRCPALAASLLAQVVACGIDERDVAVDRGPGAPASLCHGLPVDQELITDFSTAFEKEDVEGHAGVAYDSGPRRLGGQSFVFSAPGQTPPVLSLQSRGNDLALGIVAKPGVPVDDWNVWSGFGLDFGAEELTCVDATGYHGVSFTLEGNVSTCLIMLAVNISQDIELATTPRVASCTLGPSECYPPYSEPLSLDRVTRFQIAFDELGDGNPVAHVDLTSITGIGWKMYAPVTGEPCEASLFLDDVAFFR